MTLTAVAEFLPIAANAGIDAIAPYQTGKPISELERELGLTHIVKLASNENPLGCSPRVSEAIAAVLPELSRYPDGNGFELKSAIAAKFAVDLAQITLGNGSNDLLELVARALIGAGQSAVYSQHAFAVYQLAVQAVGARGIEVPARDFGHDLPAMAAAIEADTRVVFIANPNNPTGTWFDEAAFEQFMQAVPAQVVVVLDEAYVEYFPENFNSLPFLQRYPNLLISRTLSKAYGLAALRVGFALSHPALAQLLNKIRQPFNVNALALAAAVAALGDEDFLQQSRDLNRREMAVLEHGCAALGLTWIPSRANFLCIGLGPQHLGHEVFNALLHQGVIVRPVTGYGLPHFIRVTVGLPEENQRFLQALATVLQPQVQP